MILAFPEWPKDISFKECLGVQIPPEIAGGPASAKIEENSFKLPHDQRA